MAAVSPWQATYNGSRSADLMDVLRGGALLVLALAPLPFGSVQAPWTFSLEIAVSLLGGLWILRQLIAGEVEIVRTRIAVPLALVFAYLALTLVPLAPQMVALVSPEAARLHGAVTQIAASRAVPLPQLQRLSLAPFETEAELVRLASCALFFFLMLDGLRSIRGLRIAAHTLVAFGTLLSLFALVQSSWSNGKIYWSVETGSASFFGPFVNHNHFASYVEPLFGVALGTLVAEIHRFRNREAPVGTAGYAAWMWHPNGARPWIFLVATFVMLVAIVASLSRGGAISLLLTGSVFGVAWLRSARRGARWERSWRITLITGTTFLAAILLVYTFSPALQTRWEQLSSDKSVEYRFGIWRDSIGAISNFWSTGAGLDSFRSLFPRYKTHALHSETTHAENEYLQWLVETGVVGLGLAAFVAALYLKHLDQRLRRRRDAYFKSIALGALFGLAAMSIHNLVDFNLHIPSNALQFTAVAALALAASNLHRGRLEDRFMLGVVRLPIRSLRGGAAVAAALILFGGLARAAWAHFRSADLESRWSSEQPYQGEDDPDARHFARLDDALRSSPLNDRAHLMKAATYESAAASLGLLALQARQKRLAAAEKEALAALRLHPIHAAHWAMLGRIEAGLGQDAASDAAFLQAIRLAGTNGGLRREYALSLLLRREVERALPELQAARSYTPSLGLRDLLDALALATNDPRVWQRLVRQEPNDLRAYSDFLSSRGLDDLSYKFSQQADEIDLNKKKKK